MRGLPPARRGPHAAVPDVGILRDMMPVRAALARCLMLGLMVAGALVAHVPTAAQAQQPPRPQQQPQPPQREVTVQNETDLVLRELYIAPPAAREPGPDRLGQDTVAPGATYRAQLGRTADCVFDVTAVFADDSRQQRPRVDVCRNPRLVFGDPATPTLEVAVANRSQVVLRELYALPSGTDPGRGWGPDRLGASVIEPGASFAMRLRTRDCTFDLRAVYADEREEVRRALDLCRMRELAFDRTGIPRPEARSVILANRHLSTVQEVYLSPSNETNWGPDRLGTDILQAGDDATVAMEGGCEADLRIVFPSGAAEERRAVNICETTRIVLRPGWVLAERLDEEGPVEPPAPPAASPNALRLRNAGRLPIVELYAFRPGEPRGEDRLGADILPIGEAVDIEPPDPDACLSDLVVVFRDGREVARSGVDLCAGEEMEVR
jgi:hypothetical protein